MESIQKKVVNVESLRKQNLGEANKTASSVSSCCLNPSSDFLSQCTWYDSGRSQLRSEGARVVLRQPLDLLLLRLALVSGNHQGM